MASSELLRFYIVLRRPRGAGMLPQNFWAAYQKGDRRAVEDGLRSALREGPGPDASRLPFEVLDLPSRRVKPPRGLSLREERPRIVIVLQAAEDTAHRFIELFHLHGVAEDFTSGVDLPLGTHAPWCPSSGQPLFRDRPAAEALIQAGELRQVGDPQPVNVIIVDEGLLPGFTGSADALGWEVDGRQPYTATSGHGAMVGRNALAFLKGPVPVLDCPLLPNAIVALQAFLSLAQSVFIQIVDNIGDWRNQQGYGGSWVVVNAWGVYDLSQDPAPGQMLNYGRNLNHAFNLELANANQQGIDLVFAAGNCGQFCASTRCGKQDKGPGASIHGANAHPDVLTVGAVRTDGVWIGYSAEGPGMIAAAKPDLCAPSCFHETLLPGFGGPATGTSAACGVAAGVAAALRQRRRYDQVDPATLRDKLRNTAVPQGTGPIAASRFGRGIMNAEAARLAL
jgi:subtilisin family serine protease